MLYKKLVPITPEDWAIMLGLKRAGRTACAIEMGHIDPDYEVMLDRTGAEDSPPEQTMIEHPEDMHQNKFNPYW